MELGADQGESVKSRVNGEVGVGKVKSKWRSIPELLEKGLVFPRFILVALRKGHRALGSTDHSYKHRI